MDAPRGGEAAGGGAGDVAGERGRLLNVAYRLLGSLVEAEDAVQEAYTRWYGLAPARRAAVVVPGAWLTTVTARICLDVLGSARARRERYVGTWLPEPLPGAPDGGPGAAPEDPAARIVRDESVAMAFLVVLEAMTPAERVAFVLHDVFGIEFGRIAEALGVSVPGARQLASRARRRVAAAKESVPQASKAERARVLEAFRAAYEAGDLDSLVKLLHPDAVYVTDGGGKAFAARKLIHGGERIAEVLVRVGRQWRADRIDLVEAGGELALVLHREGGVYSVDTLQIADGRITAYRRVINPDKLSHL